MSGDPPMPRPPMRYNHYETCGVCHQPMCTCQPVNPLKLEDLVMRDTVHIIRVPEESEFEVRYDEKTGVVTVKKQGLLVVIGPGNRVEVSK